MLFAISMVLLTVRMRTVESRKSVNDRAHAHGQI